MPVLTVSTVGPTIMEYGTEEQKDEFLPKILSGDLHFAIGYSEPDAGTDLASLTTRAVRDGDEWVINGSKMWTSLIEYADYVWLAARTDPDAPKHKGISMFLVPTNVEGFSWTPVHTLSGRHHQPDVLRGRAGAGVGARRRAQRGLAPRHRPAQPRAGGAVLAGRRADVARPDTARGPRRPSCPTGGG